MRVLLVDSDPARPALVAEGLTGADPLDLRRAAAFDEADLRAFAPDVVVIASDEPDRDTIERLRAAMQARPFPVVMFVDRSAPGLGEEAVRAGVAAYVVGGLRPERVRPILDVAMSRFRLIHQLRADLAKAQSDLAARKTIDRAKGVLMKERQIDEGAAYAILRKLAMDSGRSVGTVAADLLAIADALKGKEL
ncbi:MAG TPA: ANTAR domain-containing protein [Caulobacterales bacterium]|nr:ANTAR domain-containing protein [Caulobacterales bacterium]